MREARETREAHEEREARETHEARERGAHAGGEAFANA